MQRNDDVLDISLIENALQGDDDDVMIIGELPLTLVPETPAARKRGYYSVDLDETPPEISRRLTRRALLNHTL